MLRCNDFARGPPLPYRPPPVGTIAVDSRPVVDRRASQTAEDDPVRPVLIALTGIALRSLWCATLIRL